MAQAPAQDKEIKPVEYAITFEGLYKSSQGKGIKNPYEITVEGMTQAMVDANPVHIFIKKDLALGSTLMRQKYPDFESFVEYRVKSHVSDPPGAGDGNLMLMNRTETEQHIVAKGLPVEARLYKDVESLKTAVAEYRQAAYYGKVEDFIAKQDERRKRMLDVGENPIVHEDVRAIINRNQNVNAPSPTPESLDPPVVDDKGKNKKGDKKEDLGV